MTKQQLLSKAEFLIKQGNYKIKQGRSHDSIKVINCRLILDENIYIGFHYHADWKEYEINYVVYVKNQMLTEFVPFEKLDAESKSEIDKIARNYVAALVPHRER
jgi:hypothetical protein